MSPAPLDPRVGSSAIRRSYVRVLVVWVATLLALYAFQEYFL